MAALATVGQFDIYHRHDFQRIGSDTHSHTVLYWQRIGVVCIALPLTLRPLDMLAWYTGTEFDATSAYGYPGPVASQLSLTTGQQEAFTENLRSILGERSVISAFIRHHPLLTPNGTLATDTEALGPTVWIDLQRSIEEQMADCRKKHRYEARKSAKNGLTVDHDESFSELSTFIELYEQRMRTLAASQSYFFPPEYYSALTHLADDACHLWHARLDGKIVGSALFFVNDGAIQYHLSASRDGYERLAPARNILEEVRQWATERSAKWLHLGGGVGGQEDSLFRFKAGFSTQRATFRVTRMILDVPRYNALCAARDQALGTERDEGFFPAYRA